MAYTIHLMGLNHRTAAVEVREKFALTGFTAPETWLFPRRGSAACPAMAQPGQDGSLVEESLILSTCNRVEVTAVIDDEAHPDGGAELIRTWSEACGRASGELAPYVYHFTGREAVEHLFNVASSLDSLVLGEPQILGQLKKAYRLAVQAGQAGTLLNRLLHMAFSVAKRVRTETAVASNAVSISYAAVELAKRIFDDMENHGALLIGAGEMAELAAMHLKKSGVRSMTIVNRTRARADELAEKIGGKAAPFEDLSLCLEQADIVISSTGAQDAIIGPDMVKAILKRRRNRPMFFIDIAMPRDIDPAVNNFDNVYLYDIDDLKEVVEENQAQRREEAAKARAIVREETDVFEEWRGSLELKPTIMDIIGRGEEFSAFVVEKTMKRLGTEDPAVREALEQMAKALMNKANHAPLEYLRDSYRHNRNLSAVATVRAALGLDTAHRPVRPARKRGS